MVAACPSCKARYRVDVSRLPAEGARLRCSRCEHVFWVRAPSEPAASPPAAPAKPRSAPAQSPSPAAEASPSPAAGASSGPESPAVPPRSPAPAPAPESPSPELTPPPSAEERQRLVLVAHPEVEEAKRIADALSSWGLDVRLAHDGVEAILSIQRSLPRLVVLDAALPKMFGFQVCELVKRNESLKEIAVVLVGAIHNEARYRRAPGELYGADAYLERQQVPDALAPLMRDLGLDRRQVPAPAPPPAPAAPSPPPRAAEPALRSEPPPRAAEPPSVSAPAPAEAPASPERATAERLARIIVSDIVLYNAERFEAAIQQGEVVQSMASELAEGRELLAQRIGDASLTEGLLEKEILRVARVRGMR